MSTQDNNANPIKTTWQSAVCYSGYFPISLLFITWLVVYGWRIFLLGFYTDDWTLYVEPQLTATWRNLLGPIREHADRPIYGFLRYLLLVIWDGSPWMLHLICSLIMLGSSLCIYFSNYKIIRWFTDAADGPELRLSAGLSGVLWLIAPWGLGYSLWASGVVGVWCTIFWCACAYFMIEYLEKTKLRYLLLSSAFLLLSYITYQTYFGAWLVLILFILAKGVIKHNYPKAFACAALFFMVQIAVALFTFLRTPKHPLPLGCAVKIWVENIICLPGNLAQIVCDKERLILLIGLPCLLILAALFIYKQYRLKKYGISIRFSLLCGIGIVISALIYAMGSYNFVTIGPDSRVFQGVSFWLCLLATLVFWVMLAPLNSSRHVNLLSISAIAILLTIFAFRNVILSRDWITVWEIENEILKNAPVASFQNLNRPTAILLREPLHYKGHASFVGNWDLSSAMCVYYHRDKNISSSIKNIFFAPYSRYKDIISRKGPDAFSEIRVWDYNSGKVIDPSSDDFDL